MFAIRVDFLTGRSASQRYDDRGSAEWPPHPARLFSALTATWAETDGDDVERAALRFLETCAAPRIAADGPDVGRRTVVPHYVPVNDVSVLSEVGTLQALEQAEEALARAAAGKEAEKAARTLEKARDAHDRRCAAVIAPGKVSNEALKAARQVLPEGRLRQPRTFPSVAPTDPSATFVFGEELAPHLAAALDRLCRRLVRVGHSSSLVAARLAEPPADPLWNPDPEGPDVLRWVAPGQLERLDAAFSLHGGVEPRVLPARFVTYRHGETRRATPEASTLFGDDAVVLVLRPSRDRRTLPITTAPELAQTIRSALMKHADQPANSLITGHASPRVPSETPHLAFVPLPHVGREHADGHLVGVALIVPKAAPEDDRAALYRAVSRWMDAGGVAAMGRAGAWTLAVDEEGDRRAALQMETWCRPSRSWASATPIALDRNPGDLLGGGDRQQRAHAEAERIVAVACERIGLPRPAQVEVSFRPPWIGAARVDRNHPPFPRRDDRVRRVQVHARIAFDEPVRGPVLLGAGRYVGLGLMRPVAPERSEP